MTLKGIDTSDWQSDLEIERILPQIDFCIAKATEGTNYVNECCDIHIQHCIWAKKLFGYYHYGITDDPISEANFFWNNTLGYTGMGIPALDYEEWDIPRNHVEWCEQFIKQYHDISNVWPMLYISTSRCADFKNSWIPEKCGLWGADYPKDFYSWPAELELTYSIHPWDFIAIWQFASDWKLKGYAGDLDANIAFMDSNAWLKYAKPGNASPVSTKPETQAKSCEELADEVLAGKWGNGWNRKQALDGAYGPGTYNHVQSIINERMI